jgi:hypothetical protein
MNYGFSGMLHPKINIVYVIILKKKNQLLSVSFSQCETVSDVLTYYVYFKFEKCISWLSLIPSL